MLRENALAIEKKFQSLVRLIRPTWEENRLPMFKSFCMANDLSKP